MNLLGALAYPLRQPRHCWTVTWRFLRMQVVALPLVVAGQASLVLRLNGFKVGLMLILLGVTVSSLATWRLQGYWLRSLRGVLHGAEKPPDPDGPLLWDGVRCSVVVALLGFVPLFLSGIVSAVGLASLPTGWSVDSTLSSWLCLLIGSATGVLALLSLALLTPLTVLLLWAGLLRLASTNRLLSALSPLGLWRDLRSGWRHYLTCFLLCATMALPLQLVGLLVMCVNVLLAPLVQLLTLPLGIYLSLVVTALLGQRHRAFLDNPDSSPWPFSARRWLPALFVVGGFALVASTLVCMLMGWIVGHFLALHGPHPR